MSRARKLLEEDVRSIPALIENKRSAEDALRFKDQVLNLPNWKTRDILPRLETTKDPLMLWVLHLELNKREIPPSLRFPSHQLGPQGDYIDLAADVFWLMSQHPNHQATFRGWRNTLKTPRGTPEWHEHLYRQFLFTYPRGMAHLASKGLGLTDQQRGELLSVPTKRMARDRAAFEAARCGELFESLHQFAIAHPDKSGIRRPTEIAQRRLGIYRTFVLSGRAPTTATKNWNRLSGEIVSRQAFMSQVKLTQNRLAIK